MFSPSLTPPPDPEQGDDILPWARAITRLLRRIVPRASPDVFPNVGSTGTTFELRRRRAVGDGGGAAAVPFCEFKCFDASTEEDGFLVGIRWGRINGRQPNNFNTRGLIEAFAISGTTYFYAAGTCDLDTLKWTDSEVIASGDPALANTSTVAYRLIGAVAIIPGEGDEPDTLEVNTSCGPVDFDICELDHF